MLSPNQIQQIADLIQAYQLNFLNQSLSAGELFSKVDFQLLDRFGFDTKIVKNDGILDYAFKLGIVSSTLAEVEARKMSFNQLKSYISSGKFIPLTKYERDTLGFVKKQSYKDIKNLGQRLASDLQASINVEDRRVRYERMIREETKSTIENRKSVKSLMSNLAHKTNEWDRDWKRVAHYILHQAFDEGRAIGIEREYGKDTLVYKDTRQDACQHCIRLYKTAGVFTKPRVFKLSDLIENGTNIGRKTLEWKAVVGPTHPNCRCTLAKVPENYDWNPITDSWDIFKPWIRKVDRKSKVKITVGNKEVII